MGALGSILGGLFLLLLGICGTIGVCSNCASQRFAAEHARQAAKDDAIRPELEARVQRLLPERVGEWTRGDLPASKPGRPLLWLVEYRGRGYETEAAFQASPEGDAAFEQWSTALNKRVEALKARSAEEQETKAPQPRHYETVMALMAARNEQMRGRPGWGQIRLAQHRVMVQLLVSQKGGAVQTQWMYQATPMEVPPEGFVEADRRVLLDRTNGMGQARSYRAGIWQINGLQRDPAPTDLVRSIQITLIGGAEDNLEAFWKDLDGKALVQGLQGR
jgi:hypothetical protein